MYKITLQNGTIIENLILNGNNYISDEQIDDSVFVDNLNEVVIENEDSRIVYESLKIVSHQIVDGKSWLIFAEPTDEERRVMQTDNRIRTVEQEQAIIVDALYDLMGV
jgi:hypothetical protein